MNLKIFGNDAPRFLIPSFIAKGPNSNAAEIVFKSIMHFVFKRFIIFKINLTDSTIPISQPGGFANLVRQAVNAAYNRARKLGEAQ